MNRLIYCWLSLALVLSMSAFALPQDDHHLRLQTIGDFHDAQRTMASKPITDTEESYRSKLDKYQQTSQAEGNLKSLIAAKQAIEDLDAGNPPSLSEDHEVAAIQKTHLIERRIAQATCGTALVKADQEYIASLKELVIDLTKSGQIDLAQEAQSTLDEFLATLNLEPAKASPESGTAEVEIWKKKALEEFPDLRNPNSPLSKKLQALKEKKRSTPNYFANPRWPYVLAKEVALSKDVRINDEKSVPIYLDDLQEINTYVYNTIGKHGQDSEKGLKKIFIKGITPKHSIFEHPISNRTASISYLIDSLGYSTYKGKVTIADGAMPESPLTFRVIGDNVTLWESRIIKRAGDIQEFSIPIKGKSKITLEVSCPGPNSFAWAVWLEPRLLK